MPPQAASPRASRAPISSSRGRIGGTLERARRAESHQGVAVSRSPACKRPCRAAGCTDRCTGRPLAARIAILPPRLIRGPEQPWSGGPKSPLGLILPTVRQEAQALLALARQLTPPADEREIVRYLRFLVPCWRCSPSRAQPRLIRRPAGRTTTTQRQRAPPRAAARRRAPVAPASAPRRPLPRRRSTRPCPAHRQDHQRRRLRPRLRAQAGAGDHLGRQPDPPQALRVRRRPRRLARRRL